MQLKCYATLDTLTVGKIESTMWAEEKSEFVYGGKTLCLCGFSGGLPRHVTDTVSKGFSPEDMVVIENMQTTYDALIKFQLRSRKPSIKKVAIKFGNLIDEVNKHPTLYTHIDFDTASGFKESYSDLKRIMELSIENIHWVITQRATTIKSVLSLAGTDMKTLIDRNVTIKDMVSQKELIKKIHILKDILELTPGGEKYNIHVHAYQGVGSDTPGAGGTPMLIAVLNLK